MTAAAFLFATVMTGAVAAAFTLNGTPRPWLLGATFGVAWFAG